MSFNADASPFIQEQMDTMGQDKLHDIVDETECTKHKCQRETLVSPWCLLLKVEQESGAALPSFLYTPEVISKTCAAETGNKSKTICPLNEYDIVL